MSSPIRRDVVANFAGAGWSAAVNLMAVPLYVRLMGIEAYGLVGFFATLQAALNLLDLGLTPTINRAMASYSVHPDKAQEARDLVRTIETGYWTLGGVIGVALAGAAPFLAVHWVKAEGLPLDAVRAALLLVALVSALQWPLSLYSGGLIGLQQLVLLNSINAAMATVRAGGALLVLVWLSPSVVAFFSWQGFVSALHTALVVYFFWRRAPAGDRRARFEPALLRTVWRFAAGVAGTTVMAVVLTQLDKIILSKVLTLSMFGYYVMAGVLANGLLLLLGPISTALFPRFTQMLTKGDTEGLRQLYHAACQLASVVALPAAVVVVFFSREILLLWTRSPAAVEGAHRLLSLLVIGTALNGLAQIPYMLQLAAGWTQLVVKANMVGLAVVAPLTLLLSIRLGGVGAAIAWVLLNCGYVLAVVPIMHTRLLRGEARRWYVKDVGCPLVAAVAAAWASRLLVDALPRPPISALVVGGAWSITQLVTAAAAPEVRARLVLCARRVAPGHEVR